MTPTRLESAPRPGVTGPPDVPFCRLELRRDASEHTYQLLAGFLMLARVGAVELEPVVVDPAAGPRSPHLATATVEGGRVTSDLLAGYNLDPRDFEDAIALSDFYFKRSHDPGRSVVRTRPYGLNYAVAMRHPLFRRLEWNASPRSGRGLAQWLVGRNLMRVEDFEAAPQPVPVARAVFITRTWDPGESRGAERARRRDMNELRAGCVRALRRALGPRVVAGLAPTPYALEHYPDSVLDVWLRRRELIALVKDSGIGIATRGLHESNGWSLGEFVAAARGIVAEQPLYAVPGGFAAGTHYLAFSTPDECVEQTGGLIDDPDRLARMQAANEAYYLSSLRPDRLVGNMLRIVLAADG